MHRTVRVKASNCTESFATTSSTAISDLTSGGVAERPTGAFTGSSMPSALRGSKTGCALPVSEITDRRKVLHLDGATTTW